MHMCFMSWFFVSFRSPELIPIYTGASILVILGRAIVGVVDGSRNIIISYDVQEECSKVVTFEEK